MPEPKQLRARKQKYIEEVAKVIQELDQIASRQRRVGLVGHSTEACSRADLRQPWDAGHRWQDALAALLLRLPGASRVARPRVLQCASCDSDGERWL